MPSYIFSSGVAVEVESRFVIIKHFLRLTELFCSPEGSFLLNIYTGGEFLISSGMIYQLDSGSWLWIHSLNHGQFASVFNL